MTAGPDLSTLATLRQFMLMPITPPTEALMRFRHRAAAGFAGLLLPLAGLVGLAAPAHPAAASSSATATCTKTQDWGTGFEGKWTVENTGTVAGTAYAHCGGVVELRHPRHHRHKADLGQGPVSGRCVLLGVQRRHQRRRAGERRQQWPEVVIREITRH